MKNPFRVPALAKMFEVCLQVSPDNFSEFYIVRSRHPNWNGPNPPRRGATHRHAFWNGYNNTPIKWDSYSKQSLNYAAYRAGQVFRQKGLSK